MSLPGVISPMTSAAESGTRVLAARLQRPRVTHVLRCRQTTALQLGQQREHQLVTLPAQRTVAHKRGARFEVSASAASAAQQPDETPATAKGPLDKFKALLSPFSEPSTNKKLLALCSAQALSSVATLIHDTYLPLYLSEELKLSNTKVGLLQNSQPQKTGFTLHISKTLDLRADWQLASNGTVSVQRFKISQWNSGRYLVTSTHDHLWNTAHNNQQANVCSIWLGVCQLWHHSLPLLGDFCQSL